MILVLSAIAVTMLSGLEISAHAQFDSPAAQQRSGVEPWDVMCNEGLFLVIRSGDRAACVRESTAQWLGLEITTAQDMRVPDVPTPQQDKRHSDGGSVPDETGAEKSGTATFAPDGGIGSDSESPTRTNGDVPPPPPPGTPNPAGSPTPPPPPGTPNPARSPTPPPLPPPGTPNPAGSPTPPPLPPPGTPNLDVPPPPPAPTREAADTSPVPIPPYGQRVPFEFVTFFRDEPVRVQIMVDPNRTGYWPIFSDKVTDELVDKFAGILSEVVDEEHVRAFTPNTYGRGGIPAEDITDDFDFTAKGYKYRYLSDFGSYATTNSYHVAQGLDFQYQGDGPERNLAYKAGGGSGFTYIGYGPDPTGGKNHLEWIARFMNTMGFENWSVDNPYGRDPEVRGGEYEFAVFN